MRILLLLIGYICLTSPTAVASKQNDKVVLARGEVIITQDDVERYIVAKVPEDKRHQTVNKPDTLRTIVENIYILRAIGNKAGSEIEIDADQMAWEVEMEKTRILSSMVIDAFIQKAYSDQDWEKAAREVYIAEPQRFLQAEQISASHILIAPDGRTDEAARELAEKLKTRIEEGELFEVLAVEFSDDPTAKKNKGALGFFGKGKMVPEFEKAVFSISEPGQLAPIVRTQFGYHIIRLDSPQKAGKKDFERVKPEILRGLRARIAAQVRENLTSGARSVGVDEVEFNENALNAIREKYRVDFPK